MELEALSRTITSKISASTESTWSADFARERPTRRRTASARSARVTLPELLLGTSFRDCIKSSIERRSLFGR